jgi:acetylornithine deacetylase
VPPEIFAVTLAANLHARIRAQLDREGAVALLRRAVGVRSVTGEEAAFAAMVGEELRAVGADGVHVEEFLPGRANAWGVRRGTGGGRSLMLLGHLDTVHVRGWEEHWAGTERESPFAAPIVDGEIWGRGVGDLKAGICANLMALKVLDRCGLKPRGDVVCVYVGDEESGEPHSGVSAGIKAIVPKVQAGAIPRADFAIYVEPTQLNIYTAQMGFLIADIKVTGKSAYFGVPELGVDALRATHAVLSALWTHNAELEAQSAHPLVGRPFLLVTTIGGGGYIAVPGECRLSLIRKLRPGDDLDEARDALEAAVRGAPVDPQIKIDIAYTAARDHAVGGTPCELDPGLDAVASLRRAVETAMPGRGEIQGAPYWSEAPFTANQLGIPTVYCAPGDITNCHTFEERVSVEEYLAAIEAYALFIADFCGVGAA